MKDISFNGKLSLWKRFVYFSFMQSKYDKITITKNVINSLKLVADTRDIQAIDDYICRISNLRYLHMI